MTYDANGNLTNDGTNSYVWDRANRLLSVGSSAYAYDGLTNRVQQTVSGTVTKYLLDMQPGLTQVIAATTGASTERYVHAPRGIHAMKSNAGQWIWPTQDGLGNVRQEVSDGLAVNGVRSYEPFLTPFDEQGSFGMPFAATGEMTDVTGQVYLRNRYMSPALGQFISLDPFEGVRDRAMSLNGYSWVEGNTPNWTDPSGRVIGELCYQLEGAGPYGEAVSGACAAVDALLSIRDGGAEITNSLNNFVDSIEQIFTQPFVYGVSNGFQFFAVTTNGALLLPNQSVALSQADINRLKDQMVTQQQFKYASCGAIPAGMPGSCGGTQAGATATPAPSGGVVAGDAGSLIDAYSVLNGGVCHVNLSSQTNALAQSSAAEQEAENNKTYYFRGTTVGFPGNRVLQKELLTPLSTQPGVATVFATVGQTQFGGQGIVYISDSLILAAATLIPESSLFYEFQVVLHNFAPLDFVSNFVISKVSAAKARQILQTLGVNIDSRITRDEQSAILEALAQRPLTKPEISTFVQMARNTP